MTPNPNGITEDFIRALPKTDLHVHLDGSLRLSTLIELARAEGVALPTHEESGLRELVFKEQYGNLTEYLRGFAYTVAVMQRAENIERIAYEFALDNLAEGVRYVEVRFAPQLHINEHLDMRGVIAAATRGLDRAKREHNASASVREGRDIPFEFGIIVCALRWFSPVMSSTYRQFFQVMEFSRPRRVFAAASLELARAASHLARGEGLPIVGFDLAGAEDGNPAVDHREAFLHAHQFFLRKTLHAGEAYGPESIFQAITQCHANRIGHGTHLFSPEKIQDPGITDRVGYVQLLSDYIASQRITIEVNLTSNMQTLPGMSLASHHPLGRMVREEMSATICTDNRLVSNTTVTREILLAVQNFNITRPQLRKLVIAGFKGSFFPGPYTRKRAYVRDVIDRYEALEKSMTPPPP